MIEMALFVIWWVNRTNDDSVLDGMNEVDRALDSVIPLQAENILRIKSTIAFSVITHQSGIGLILPECSDFSVRKVNDLTIILHYTKLFLFMSICFFTDL